jgi:hypothetical protein
LLLLQDASTIVNDKKRREMFLKTENECFIVKVFFD